MAGRSDVLGPMGRSACGWFYQRFLTTGAQQQRKHKKCGRRPGLNGMEVLQHEPKIVDATARCKDLPVFFRQR